VNDGQLTQSGMCFVPHVVDEGASCANESAVCPTIATGASSNYYCDPQSQVCVASVGEGGPVT
jgi:hypothetical protein